MSELKEEEKELLETALRTMKNAHVVWGLKVGAAVLGEDGKMYGGCNVESWISGLGLCAERCAIDHAVLHGNRKIQKVAIVMDADKHEKPRPCGSCLQYIHDFATKPKIKILMAHAQKGRITYDTVETKTLSELLPCPYKK